MRVVLATHNTRNRLGVNKYFYLLAEQLARLGVDVQIIVDSMDGALAVLETCHRPVKVTLLEPTASGGLATARYCQNLRTYLLDRSDFDVLHCGHVLPFFYLHEGHRPVVFQPFGNELFTLAGRGIGRLYCWLAQPILRFCGEYSDVLLTEGTFQHAEMRRYYPKYFRDGKALETLPVGVNIGVERKAVYTPNSPFHFLAVNSLLPYEGMSDLLQAFSVVHDTCCARLVIVGTGIEELKLKEMARQLNIGSSVEFRKNIPESELQALYTESDAFISTSYETDVQMGVLEAMASGLPVLCREAAWVPASVVRFRTDGLDLADKMAAMTSDSACNRRQVAEKGLEEVRQYSFTEIAGKALAIYEAVM